MARNAVINGFRKNLVSLAVGLMLAGVVLCGAPAAQQSAPYPRVSKEGFLARLPFFAIDPSIPLHARVVWRWDKPESVREKIVFRGAQNFLVPGYLEFPKAGKKPYPLVLLLHGWSGSKDVWYVEHNIYHGALMRRALLRAGYAILALDAATHGERSNMIDYHEVNTFNSKNAPPVRNYFTFTEISVQTTKDYQRALDYMARRGDIDMKRIGLVGYSMGGMDAFYLLSVEPLIKVAVACVPPLYNPGYGPTSPIDYTWGIGKTPFLMLMGRKDTLGDPAKVEASYRDYLKGPNTKLIWFDSGHKLPAAYVQDALSWVERYMPARTAQ
ncbi:MAG: alpha/beta fold hydrolase [Acidobacteria bacterium]|nr:alpha/beta fold hydrolase [Acidobacteriota bacterium]